MAQLQSSCILGTLSLSASNASAQNSVIIGGASNNTEFSNYSQCNIIAIGENTALSGSGGLDETSINTTQEGSFCIFSYYQRYVDGCPSPSFACASASNAGGSGATFSIGHGQGSGVNPTITLGSPGSGYTGSLTVTISDSAQAGETCEIFTIDPMTSTDVINIGNNAGCRAQGSNNIRIGACAAPGNFEGGTHLHINSIAIGKNTMHSGSFIDSVVVGHCSFTGCLANKTGNSAKLKCITVVGNHNVTNLQTGICCSTILGSCNANGTWNSSLHNSTIIGFQNNCATCYMLGSVVIGHRNALSTDSCKRGPTNAVIIGCLNLCCSSCTDGTVAIGKSNMSSGIIRGARCSVAIGSCVLKNITTAQLNVGVGLYSGCNTTTGNCNVYLGYFSGKGNCTGARSVFIGCGTACGLGNQSDSIFIGPAVGRYGGSTQGGHVVVGVDALRNMCAGYFNVAIGYQALYVGAQSSTSCAINGGCNIAIGYLAGGCTVAGSNNNIYIGQRSGRTSRGNETYKFYLGQGSGNHLMCGCLNSSARTLCVNGTLSKTAGSFAISHPDPSKNTACELFHSFVESPTAGDNLYRFEVEVENGTATIDLPDYYKHLNENDQVWVNPKNHFGRAYGVVNQEQTALTIFADTDGNYNVLLIGTRKDKDAAKAWKGTERLKEN